MDFNSILLSFITKMTVEKLNNNQELVTEVQDELKNLPPEKATFPETQQNLDLWNNQRSSWSPDEPPADLQTLYQNKEWKSTDISMEDSSKTVNIEKTVYERSWKTTTLKQFEIRNLDSNESVIPVSEKDKIINAINHLSNFEKVVIVWCTDASPINWEVAIQYNQRLFDDIYKKYISKWWDCPTYDDLLKIQPDPQNAILWYRRAMEWVLSLWLNEEQMKKIKIESKLWQNQNDPNERWFDINIDYAPMKKHIVTEVAEYLKKICGELDDNSLSYEAIKNNAWEKIWYKYRIHETKFSTDINNLRTQLYKDILWDPWKWDKFDGLTAPEYESKKALIDKEINKYLEIAKLLVPNYANDKNLTGLEKTSHIIERREFYLIKLSKKLNEEQFRKVLEWWSEWLNIIWNMQLNDIKDENWNSMSVEQFIQRNNVSRVDNDGAGTNWFHYYNNSKLPLKERRISKEDYILLWMYFQMK